MLKSKKAKPWQKQLQNPNSPPAMTQEARKRIISYKEAQVESPYGFSTTVVKTFGVYRQVFVD